VRDGVIESNEDNAMWNYFKSGTITNGLYVAKNYNEDTKQNTGGDTHAAADIICYMNGYNDPRRAVYFVKSTEWADQEYVGLRRGWETFDKNWGFCFCGLGLKSTDPYIWLTASEVAFLRAEGAAGAVLNVVVPEIGEGDLRPHFLAGIQRLLQKNLTVAVLASRGHSHYLNCHIFSSSSVSRRPPHICGFRSLYKILPRTSDEKTVRCSMWFFIKCAGKTNLICASSFIIRAATGFVIRWLSKFYQSNLWFLQRLSDTRPDAGPAHVSFSLGVFQRFK